MHVRAHAHLRARTHIHTSMCWVRTQQAYTHALSHTHTNARWRLVRCDCESAVAGVTASGSYIIIDVISVITSGVFISGVIIK